MISSSPSHEVLSDDRQVLEFSDYFTNHEYYQLV